MMGKHCFVPGLTGASQSTSSILEVSTEDNSWPVSIRLIVHQADMTQADVTTSFIADFLPCLLTDTVTAFILSNYPKFGYKLLL